MSETTNAGEKHVAVLAFPFGTHAAPLLSLVSRIAATAPNVYFSFFCTSNSNNSVFSNEGLNNIKPYDVYDGLPEGYTCSFNNPIEPVMLFLKAMPENYKSVMEVAVRERRREISCIMSDAFFGFAGKMAEEMDVNWVPVWTAGPRSLLVHVDTDVIRKRLGDSGSEDQTLEIIPGFSSSMRAVDLPEGVITNISTPFSMMLHNMGLMLPNATAVAINSYEEIDLDIVNILKQRFHEFLNVGPFLLTCPQTICSDEHGCLEWLDKHKADSVAYISFGSVITLPPPEQAALAEALEASGFPFLWSLRSFEESLPKGFIERTRTQGKIVPWAPQMLVLGHRSVGVFVTHCGWNSVLESVIAAVPMICRPFFGDQRLNMRTVEASWGIGVGLESGVFTKDGMVKALEQTMSSEQGKEMRKKAEAFNESALEAVACDGSSTKDINTLVKLVTS